MPGRTAAGFTGCSIGAAGDAAAGTALAGLVASVRLGMPGGAIHSRKPALRASTANKPNTIAATPYFLIGRSSVGRLCFTLMAHRQDSNRFVPSEHHPKKKAHGL